MRKHTDGPNKNHGGKPFNADGYRPVLPPTLSTIIFICCNVLVRLQLLLGVALEIYAFDVPLSSEERLFFASQVITKLCHYSISALSSKGSPI